MKLNKCFRNIAILVLLVFAPSIINEAKPAEVSIFEASAGRTTVYVCTGPNAEKYHKSSKCRGIRKSSCKIVSIDLADAKKAGYKPCKICY